MRRFDAYDQSLVAQRHLSRGFRFHVRENILVLRSTHSSADNIQERQHPRLRSIDDALLEILKVSPARAAGIGHRRNAGAESESVRIYAKVSSVGSRLTSAGVDVDMDIHQAGRDVKSAHIDNLQRLRGIDMLSHGGDLSIADSNVPHRTDLVLGVDNVTTLQKQIVLILGEAGSGHKKN